MALPIYATVDDLKDRVFLDPSDSRNTALQDVLEVASRWVDRETYRRFYTTTETRYYSVHRHRYSHYNHQYDYRDTPYMWESPWGSTGLHTLYIDDVVSVTSITTDTDGDGVFETTWTSGIDYWLGPRNAAANLEPYTSINRGPFTTQWFPYYENAIAVTGAFGYCTPSLRPPEIRELTIIVASYLLSPNLTRYTLANSAGETDLTIPGVQEYQIGQELRVVMQKTSESLLSSEIPKEGLDLVNKFRRSPAMVI